MPKFCAVNHLALSSQNYKNYSSISKLFEKFPVTIFLNEKARRLNSLNENFRRTWLRI
jgi:hypothetical protein